MRRFVDRRWLDVRVNARINRVDRENQARARKADETVTTNFKHDMETRHEYKDRRTAEKADEQLTCYQQVDARDQSVCRVTGVYLVLGHPDPHKRKERHHLNPRSLGGPHDAANVITISGALHALIHAGKAHLEGDANLRDPDGKFCGVRYEVVTDSGWETVRLV